MARRDPQRQDSQMLVTLDWVLEVAAFAAAAAAAAAVGFLKGARSIPLCLATAVCSVWPARVFLRFLRV